MDDLLDNFADQSLESPTEEGYKYHFINGSPAVSEHARPDRTAATAPAVSGNDDPFFDNEASGIPQGTTSGVEDEADYNADVDDDDEDEHRRDEASRYESYHQDPTTGASYNDKSLLENDTDDLDPSFYNEDYDAFATQRTNSRVPYPNLEPSLAPSGDGRDELDAFAQHLRRIHRQDMERDELLTKLHQENLDLKRTLKESVPGGNPRAEAAERSLFEIRKALASLSIRAASDINPYVCVLIDGKGYKIHEDLLQSGKIGGAEAADRLWTEVSNYLQQFGDAKYWEIMVHFYIDIEGILARCVSADIPLLNGDVRGFMLGFTQARPLFTIVDVGNDPGKVARKVDGMFHLFVNNVQCKHLIFGCCHNRAYAVTLEPYAFNPITAFSITLLKSYEDDIYFGGLPFSAVEFPHVFRSTPFKETDRLAEELDIMQDFPPQSGSGGIMRQGEKTSANEITGEDEALAKWQAASNASIPLPTRFPRPAKPQSTWGSNQTVLLNINDERVDPPLLEEDYDASESMKDRMEVRRFCHFYHLMGNCVSLNPGFRQDCKFRHGPKLNPEEIVVLGNNVKNLPCGRGSRCRQPDCVFGHICHDQPGCTRGARCLLHKFHEVDPTVVRVWSGPSAVDRRRF